MDDDESDSRYLRKMRDLIRGGTHIARMNDLLARIKAKLPVLEELLGRIEEHWGEEDGVYRFYHQSYKVFHLQELTKQGFKLIEEIGGESIRQINGSAELSRKELNTSLITQ